MNTYVEIHGVRYPATIGGRMDDKNWDGRESKSIQVEMSYEDASALFIDNLEWSIVQTHIENEEIEKEDGTIIIEPVTKTETFNNDDFCIVGDISVHRNGTVTVKMGKPTTEEILAILMEE